MTNAELNFYTRVPDLLANLVGELRKLNQNLESIKASAKAESDK
jgi:hypothetical protein